MPNRSLANSRPKQIVPACLAHLELYTHAARGAVTGTRTREKTTGLTSPVAPYLQYNNTLLILEKKIRLSAFDK